MGMDLKICISTCFNYSEKTLPICVNSLLESGIFRNNIIIVEGGNAESSESSWNEIRKLHANHNSFDYTALIEVVDREIQGDFFLLHDTFRAGEAFKDKLFSVSYDVDRRALKPWPSMSVGYYSAEFLQKIRSDLLALRNYDYTIGGLKDAKRQAIQNEDLFLHKKFGQAPVYGDDYFEKQEVDKKWFESTVYRCQEYYPQLDLYKLKANFGSPNPHDPYVITL